MEKKETKEKKYIICDCAAQNHGKTETLLGLIDYFQSHFGYAPIPIIPIRAKRDRLFLFHLPNKDVVVDTYGDPYPMIFLRWLNAAANTNAKIIFAACRTGRSQKNEVLKIAADYGYEVIWFSNFYWSNFNAMTASVRQHEIECLSDLAHML